MTKLNKSRIKWLVRQVVKHGRKPSEVASVYEVSVRRVQQLVRHFKEHGTVPELRKERRPKTFLNEGQKEAINRVFNKTLLSPRLLYYELKKSGTPVAKNKVYTYLKSQGKVIPDVKKQKQRKRCRYERKHSGSLVHTDWHRTTKKHPYCILYEDDASRKVLAGREFKALNGNNSAIIGEEAVKESAKLNVLIHAINADHGSEFTSDEYARFLNKNSIKMVFSRVKNPQTNGKLERLWYEYDRHRWHFSSLKEWIEFYNNRLHGALKLEWAETPNEAFQRKLRPECLIGMMFK